MKRLIYILSIWYIAFSSAAEEVANANLYALRDRMQAEARALEEQEEQFIPTEPNITFQDLVGLIPIELIDIVREIRKNEVEGRPTKSAKIMFYGRPGGGKTTLAKAVAGELRCQFYNVLAGDLITKYQGSGNERITALIKAIVGTKKEKVPLKVKVLFIDEADGLANEEHANTSSELRRAVQALHKLDSIEYGLLCFIATNEPEKLAKTLKSRFAEEQICIELPNIATRFAKLQRLFQTYNIEGINLRKIASLLEGFDFRELEAYVRKVTRIANSLQPVLGQAIPNAAFMLALYMMNKSKVLAVEQAKKLFAYWTKRFIPEASQEHIDLVLNEPLLQSCLSNLTAQDIKKAAVSLQGLRFLAEDAQITPDDIFISIYYDNDNKLPSALHIQKFFHHFLEFDLEDGIDLSQDLADNCTGKEIHALVEMARSETENRAELQNALMKHICILLKTKAKPYEVIERIYVTKQYTNDGSVSFAGNHGFGAGVSFVVTNLSTNGGASATFSRNSTSYHITPFNHFCIEKRPLKDTDEFKRTIAVSDEDEKLSRLDFCNVRPPSLTLVRFIINQQLLINNMNLTVSQEHIYNFENFLKIIVTSQLSINALEKFVQFACDNAYRAQSNECNREHLIQAFFDIGLNIQWYQDRNIKGSHLDRPYQGRNIAAREAAVPAPAAPGNCIIS